MKKARVGFLYSPKKALKRFVLSGLKHRRALRQVRGVGFFYFPRPHAEAVPFPVESAADICNRLALKSMLLTPWRRG